MIQDNRIDGQLLFLIEILDGPCKGKLYSYEIHQSLHLPKMDLKIIFKKENEHGNKEFDDSLFLFPKWCYYILKYSKKTNRTKESKIKKERVVANYIHYKDFNRIDIGVQAFISSIRRKEIFSYMRGY